MINDGEQITEEKFSQEYKKEYDCITQVLQPSNYLITWDELLKKLNDDVEQGLIEESPIKETGSPSGLIYLAYVWNDIKLVKWLIDNGADVDCIYPIKSGNTLLLLAAKNGNVELVKLLIDNGADVDYVNYKGDTPLHLAVESGSQECVMFLAKKNYQNVYCSNFQGETPLHLAVRNSNLECMKLVAASHSDAIAGIFPNINNQNIEGNTALHLAAENNHSESIQFLINEKADTTIVNNNRETALYVAIKNYCYNCAEYLVENTPQSKIGQKSKEGKTVLNIVVSDDTTIWIEKRELLMLLLDKSDNLTINAAYNSAKNLNDTMVLKVFQNCFLKKKRNMKKNSTRLEKQESWSRDFILYVSNISSIMTSVLILIKEIPQYPQAILSTTFADYIITIISKILLLLTIPVMIYAYRKHKELDRFNDTIDDYKTKICETADLIKTKVKENDDLKVEAQCSADSKSLQKAELPACKLIQTSSQLKTIAPSLIECIIPKSKSLFNGLNSPTTEKLQTFIDIQRKSR